MSNQMQTTETEWRDIDEDRPPEGMTVLLAARNGEAWRYGVGLLAHDIIWDWGWRFPPTHWALITPPKSA